MKDPQMIAEAKRFGIDIDPLSGAAIEGLMREVDAVPQAVIDKLRKMIEPS